MMPREVLHVCASSPRRITVDPGGSSPTFPTCWLDCRRAGRPCSLKIQSWLPAAVQFPGPARTSLAVFCRISRFATSSLLQSSLLSGVQSPHAGVSLGAHIVAGPGGGTSLRSSTRCPRADGTTSLKSVARTLMKRRVVAPTGRSRTPRRSQTPLAFGQRGDGHGSARSLFSLTDVSCELPLC